MLIVTIGMRMEQIGSLKIMLLQVFSRPTDVYIFQILIY